VNLAFVRRSIQLSADAVAHGNHPFGALLVKDDQIILEAENSVSTEHDLTNHAELSLVRLAVKQFLPNFLENTTLYTSTEPCAMCAGAIYWAGLGEVIYACSAQRLAGFAGEALSLPCRDVFSKGIRKIYVTGPVLEQEASIVHAAYWRHTADD